MQTIDKPIGIAFILVGDDAPSKIYVQMKQKACEKVGFTSTIISLSGDISEKSLIQAIEEQNQNKDIYGILVQQPLPSHINLNTILNAVDPNKDVDGFHPLNLGKMISQDPSGFIPCTPLGITTLLNYYDISLEGKHVVVIGRSLIVGKPLSILLSQKADSFNATVTLIHSRSTNITPLLRSADIIIAAAGSRNLIKPDQIKQGAVLIDVGIHREPSKKGSYKIVGDLDFESLKDKCSAISPVPGGVGPMTIATLLTNTFLSFKAKNN